MKQTLLIIAAVLSLATATAQQPWQVINKAAIPTATVSARDSHPKKFDLYKLDINSLKAQLQQAPLRQSGQTSSVIITLPNADGQMQHFRVYNAPVLSSRLAVKYPNIQTYVGQCVEEPATVIRFSTTLYGLHVMALAIQKQGTIIWCTKRVAFKPPKPSIAVLTIKIHTAFRLAK